LVQFLFRNPHSFVHVEGKDEKGETVRFAIEWGGGGALGRQGVTRETLKPGDHVIIVGNPGRNPDDHRLRMVRLKRTSDGWTWGGKPGETFDLNRHLLPSSSAPSRWHLCAAATRSGC